MKKSGFTLTEVLITLGIIGVVAALTAPGLVLRSTQNANASKLASMVANIEGAFTNAIAEENVDGLDEVPCWNNNAENNERFIGCIGQFLHIAGYGQTNNNARPTENVSDYYGGNSSVVRADNADTLFVNAVPIFTKSGCVLFFHKQDVNEVANEADIRAAGGALIHKAANVIIDVNGIDPPNEYGRDIFGFLMSNEGILYPIGGNDVIQFATIGDNRERYPNGIENTATIVQNGYRFD